MAGFTGQGLPENFPIEFLPGEVSQLTGHRAEAALSDPGAPVIEEPTGLLRGDAAVEAAEFHRARIMAEREASRRAAYNAARRTADLMAGVGGGYGGPALDSALASKARNIDELKAIMDGETLQRNKPNIDTRMAPHTPFYWHGADRFHTGLEPAVTAYHEGQSPEQKFARASMVSDMAEAQMHGRDDPDVRGGRRHISSFFQADDVISGANGGQAADWEDILRKAILHYGHWEEPDDTPAGFLANPDQTRQFVPGDIPTELLGAIKRRDAQALAEFSNDLHANPTNRSGGDDRFHDFIKDKKAGLSQARKQGREEYRDAHGGMNPDRVAAARLAASREAALLTPRGRKRQKELEAQHEARALGMKLRMMPDAMRAEWQKGQNAIAIQELQGAGMNQFMRQREREQFWTLVEQMPGNSLEEKIAAMRALNIRIPEGIFNEAEAVPGAGAGAGAEAEGADPGGGGFWQRVGEGAGLVADPFGTILNTVFPDAGIPGRGIEF